MSEVVVQLNAEDAGDSVRLSEALDAFAKWCSESGILTDSGDAPDIMMMTEHTVGGVRRKLVFQDRDQAARFLVFWRSERQRPRTDDSARTAATA